MMWLLLCLHYGIPGVDPKAYVLGRSHRMRQDARLKAEIRQARERLLARVKATPVEAVEV